MTEDKPCLNLLDLRGHSIYNQLQIEEALLRASSQNWCILNEGSHETAVVMGISHNAHEVVSQEHYVKNPITLIRRFSGGGTVVVDENTIFFSLILSENSLPQAVQYPKELMKWIYELIKPAFEPHQLDLEENDFAINKMKIGGNAQSFIRGRVLHHTSFLWNWTYENMNLLTYPKQVPAYRQQRDHGAFCGKLESFYSSKRALIDQLQKALMNRFNMCSQQLDSGILNEALRTPHRKSLQLLSNNSFVTA